MKLMPMQYIDFKMKQMTGKNPTEHIPPYWIQLYNLDRSLVLPKAIQAKPSLGALLPTWDIPKIDLPF